MEVEKYAPFKVKIVHPIFRFIFSNWMRLLTLRLNPFRIQSSGLVPREGGLVIVANHLADIDPVLLQYACPRPVHYMAKHDLFDWKVIGPLMKYFHAFPVKRNTADRTAIKHAIALARAGEVVGIFPEGELSETGELLPLLPGATLVIRQAGVPAICCRLEGTNDILPYGQYVPRFRPGATLRAQWSEPRDLTGHSTEEIMAWMEANLRPE